MNIKLRKNERKTAEKFIPSNDFDDEEDFKDVFHPDFEEFPGESLNSIKLRYAFTCAGYRIRKYEEFDAPPVIVVRLIQTTAPLIRDPRILFKHIQGLLRQAGFRRRKDELTVDRTANRIVVAFISGKPAPNFEDILREQQENVDDDAALPF
jgi:hypothetical protein